jgi:hypothetical protein
MYEKSARQFPSNAVFRIQDIVQRDEQVKLRTHCSKAFKNTENPVLLFVAP